MVALLEKSGFSRASIEDRFYANPGVITNKTRMSINAIPG